MTLEDTLSELGNTAFSVVPNYRAVLAYVNSCFTRAAIPTVDGNTPSDKILEQIYSITDVDMQTTLLARPVKDMKADNRFKKVLVISGILIASVITMVVLLGIFSSVPLTPEMIGLIKDIAAGVFEVIKLLLGQG